MGDLVLAFDPALFEADLVVEGDDLATGDDLLTAVVVSLFTELDWWGDALAEVPGDRIGCGIWALRRSKRTQATLLRARDECRRALAWLLEDRVAAAVDVACEWQGARLAIGITIAQPGPGAPRRFAFLWAWEA